ncbi:unnamed protein product, partial [Phaeothamnion confervicola]
MRMRAEEARIVLGVEIDASEADLKKAYRRLALTTHPDKCGGDPAAKLKFQRVCEAYKRLTDTHADSDDEEGEDDEDDARDGNGARDNDDPHGEADEEEMMAMFEEMFGPLRSAMGMSTAMGTHPGMADIPGIPGMPRSAGGISRGGGIDGGGGMAGFRPDMDDVEDLMEELLAAGLSPDEALNAIMGLLRGGGLAGAAAAAAAAATRSSGIGGICSGGGGRRMG